MIKVFLYKIIHDLLIQALMVVGGADAGGVGVVGNHQMVSTVEIMVEETWSFVASLPSPRYYHKAATLKNSVFVFGK